ncbi:MAG: hypothetical protein H7833_00430 [Magnetococcus sp. DMHC-1]
MSKLLASLVKRSREPSTWGGLATLLILFGLSNEQAKAITELVAAASALVAVFMPENKTGE